MNHTHLHVPLKIMSVLMLFLAAPVYAGKVLVDYDSSQDLIQVQANNASLTQVLAEIANKTNIVIRIDPAVEKEISINLPPQSLQQALQKVVKGLSYVIEYKIDEKQQTVVSGLRLLPKGKQNSGQLVSVAVLNARVGQNSRGGDRDFDGSINRRGNYYPGSRRSSPNPQVQRPTNNMQGGMDGNDTLVQDGAVDTVRQQAKPQAKKIRPKAPHPDLP